MEAVGRHHQSAVALCLALFCVLFAGAAAASSQGEAVAFEKAYELYLGNQYAKAIEAFDLFLADFPLSSAADSVYFWKAKSLLHLKKDEEARQLFGIITKRFPESPYRKIAEREMAPPRAQADERPRPAEDTSKKQSRVVVVGSQEKKIRELEDERDAMKQQVAELGQKLQLSEKGISRAAKDREENGRAQKALEKRILELEAEKKSLADEIAGLKLKPAEAGEGLQKTQSPAKSGAAASDARDREEKLRQEISSLRSRLLQAEAPGVTISNRKYSASDILRADAVSSRVLSKMQVLDCAWRGNGAIENFAREQQLMSFAASHAISVDPGQVAALAKRHSFSQEETEFLSRYLTIERAVKKKLEDLSPNEQEIRQYYEVNRDAFRENRGADIAHVVSIRYDAATEIEQGMLAVDIRNEVLRGARLEDVSRAHKEVVFQVRKADDLPVWVRERTAVFRDGEVSDVLATEQDYLIVMLFRQKPAYRKYEDVRAEIAGILRAARPAQRAFLAAWFAELSGSGAIVMEPVR